MPIENSIDNLAAAINALAAAISGKAGATPTPAVLAAHSKELDAAAQSVADGAAQAKADGSAKKSSAATKPAATPPTAEVEKAAAQEKKADSSDGKPGSTIDFETQIRKPIVAMAGGGRRDVALKILSSFGAAKASEIKPEDYEAAVAAIVAAG